MNRRTKLLGALASGATLATMLVAADAIAVEEPVAPVAADAPWLGEPTWIGGTNQIDAGEWIHTDFVVDDGHRADNAADLVEVRVRPVTGGYALRVTLNSLRSDHDPVIGVAVAEVGGSAGDARTAAWPHGAGVHSNWNRFLTVRTTGVESAAVDGVTTSLGAPAVDLDANTIEAVIPSDAIGLDDLTIGAGVWAGDGSGWAGGVLDLAFNHEHLEPVAKNWRDVAQQAAIDDDDLAAFSVDIDFAELATDQPFTLAPGTHNRIYRTIQDLGEGLGGEFPRFRGLYQPYSLYVPPTWDPAEPAGLQLALHSLNNWHNEYNGTDVFPELAGRRGALAVTPLALGVDGWYWDQALVDTLQVWADVRANYLIDDDRVAAAGYSMGGYATYRLTTMFPDRFAGAATWAGVPAYYIWAYPVDPPVPFDDRAQVGNTFDLLENTLHIPFHISHGTNDELVPVTGVTRQAERFHELGHEYRYHLHPGQDHFTFGWLDDYSREGQWLEGRQRETRPAEVRFKVRPPAWASPDADTDEPLDVLDTPERIDRDVILGHFETLGYDPTSAWWVHDVVVSPHEDFTQELGDVHLISSGIAPRIPSIREVASASAYGSSPHVTRGLDRSLRPAALANRLHGTISGVDSLTVDLAAAGLSADGLDLGVAVDRPVTLTLVDGDASTVVTLVPAA